MGLLRRFAPRNDSTAYSGLICDQTKYDHVTVIARSKATKQSHGKEPKSI